MEIYRSPFVVRNFDASTGILSSVWLPSTQDMEDEQFKQEMLSLADLLASYNASTLLTYLNDLRFPIVPELQHWIAQTIVPRFRACKLKKQAIIVPKDYIAQLSIEQTIDDVEDVAHEHATRFFTDDALAIVWLCK